MLSHFHSALAGFVLLACVRCSTPAFAQQPDREAIVTKHALPAIKAMQFPGVVVGIHMNGVTTYHRVGTLNYDTDQPPAVDTLYEIGSISKLLTGVLFADAVRRGEVQRETPLDELLPFRIRAKTGSDGEPILLWHLSTHTSGWARNANNTGLAGVGLPYGSYPLPLMLHAIATMPVHTAPGTEYSYSNFGVSVLGTILASRIGTAPERGNYEALVTRRVLEPLKIIDMAITLSDEQRTRLAPATVFGAPSKPWGTRSALAPAGMWVTSAPGLMGFALANLDDGAMHTQPIYESLALAREPLFRNDITGQQHGSGWFIAPDGQTYWHNGMTGGYASYLALRPDRGLAVVVLANGATYQTTPVGRKIMQELLGHEQDPIRLSPPRTLDEPYLSRIVGRYQSPIGYEITLSTFHGQLFGGVTGQQVIRLEQAGDDRFVSSAVDGEMRIDFPQGDQSAPATSITLYFNGAEIKCVRVKE